ncbi:hook-length control protein FliK [Alkalithermobacter thermoalcaliphilus JW-YL-7 = DSM 7308]|uniref:Flagellar hook-length control protein-like protein n=1 Tax=Alkalithermobacter thermoalcaliphilus JW-YL-7 = DSM 7308 TaxID=1121328 RepID=A0A150FRW4_CLOPD|nr:Flagellar hook-length control protein-like protein [[Clostridium] paradoxum JW-YL-7 = DSM 7308]SHK61297.1 hook-length control protein FliK [[Clostridium] paradoxum JW-YL-7 = DSM 7308]
MNNIVSPTSNLANTNMKDNTYSSKELDIKEEFVQIYESIKEQLEKSVLFEKSDEKMTKDTEKFSTPYEELIYSMFKQFFNPLSLDNDNKHDLNVSENEKFDQIELRQILEKIEKKEYVQLDDNIKFYKKTVQINDALKLDSNSIELEQNQQVHKIQDENLENNKLNIFLDKKTLKESNFEVTKYDNDEIDQNISLAESHKTFTYTSHIKKTDTINSTKTIEHKNLIDQISNKIKLNISDNTSSIEIKLEPESLGKLIVKVVLEKGILTARLITQNEEVRSFIELNIEELKDSLIDKGINIQSLSVSVDSQREDFNRHMNILKATSYNKRINKERILSEIEEKTEKNPYLEIDDNFNYLG